MKTDINKLIEKADKEKRFIADGIYDITGISFILLEDYDMALTDESVDKGWFSDDKIKQSTAKARKKELKKKKAYEESLKKFARAYSKFYIAAAYETQEMILLSKKPKKLPKSSEAIGSGFNYGSTNIITNCPKSILILAEDD